MGRHLIGMEPAAPRYADDSSLAEAREAYFAASGFGPESYEERWVKLKMGPIPIAFPNTAARKRTVKLHDLHHIATEYQTTWRGEAEISAWELAAGCHRHWVAWALNSAAMFMGLFIAPRRTVRAFRRGRSSRTLYRNAELDPAMLEMSVGELRTALGL
jgi:hypothetical protein